MAVCARCRKPKAIKSRRLCNGCYTEVLADGTADNWPRVWRHDGDVLAHVCALWDITVVQLVEDRHRVDPRAYAAHLMSDELGMRPAKIAASLGWSEQAVRNWLAGNRPTPPRDVPAVRKWTVCPVPDCGRPSHAGLLGLCSGHSSRRRRHGGRLLADVPLKQFRTRGRDETICKGTATSYRDGCRCDVCLKAATRRKQLLDLAGPQMVDVEPAVAHLREAMRRGMLLRDVSAQAGVPLKQLYRFTAGRHAKTRRTTVEKILAVPLQCEQCEKPGMAGGRWCVDHYMDHVRSAA